MKLDSLLQSLPKQITVEDIVVMNVTFAGNPVLSNSSIELEINGLFAATDDLVSNIHLRELSEQDSCNPYDKMVEMSFHENVFNSLSSVLFDVSFMSSILFFSHNYSNTVMLFPLCLLQGCKMHIRNISF